MINTVTHGLPHGYTQCTHGLRATILSTAIIIISAPYPSIHDPLPTPCPHTYTLVEDKAGDPSYDLLL